MTLFVHSRYIFRYSNALHRVSTFNLFSNHQSHLNAVFSRWVVSDSDGTPMKDILNGSYIPDPPTPLESQLILNSLGEPTFASLGLTSYWPSGLYRSVLEAAHVDFGLSWWVAIMTGTLILRLFLTPLMIRERKNMEKMTKLMPRASELQSQLTAARLSGSYTEMLKVSKELNELISSGDMNPLKHMRGLFVQIPVFVTIFTAIRGLTNLPVESMRNGGLLWFLDLTQADPYYVLPALNMLVMMLMFHIGMGQRRSSLDMRYQVAFRILPIFGFLFTMNFPCALLLHWSVSNSIALTQTYLFSLDAVRKRFNYPEIPKMESRSALVGTKKEGFIEGFKKGRMLLIFVYIFVNE